jgi:putative heme-binding domain-containing protein
MNLVAYSPPGFRMSHTYSLLIGLICLRLLTMEAAAQSDPKLPFPQNRVKDFYSRQAEQFLDHRPPGPVDVLPQFPGLDGGGFGHWGQNPEEVSFDQSLNEVDTGNVVAQLTRHFGQTTFKGVNVEVDAESKTTMLYDPLRITFVDAWKGGFVKWGFVRFGLMGGVEPAGQRFLDFTQGGWQLPQGINSRYLGYYRHGRQVAFSTQIGEATILDSVSVIEGQLLRTLQFEGSLPASFLKIVVSPAGAKVDTSNEQVPQISAVTADGKVIRLSLSQQIAGVKLAERDGSLGLEFAGGRIDGVVSLQIASGASDSIKPPAKINASSIVTKQQYLAGASGQWTTKIVETKGALADDSGPMALDSVTLPQVASNPFKSAMRIGGVGCLEDGRVVVSTLMGEVWLVDGIDTMATKPLRWQRIAAGFYQALGIVIQEGKILVLGSDQITRLHDFNGDHETDFYECVTNAFPTTGGHDFCTSLQQDQAGRLYWAISSGDFGVARMNSAGAIESLGNGLRNSNGIGVSPDGSVVLASVQEGTWTPASAIFEVAGHSYHGLKGPKPDHGKYGYDLPLVFLPRGLDNSSGEIGFLPTDKRLGPLSGAAIGTSFGACQTYVVLRDVVNGKAQGAVVPLPGDYLSGVCRVAFNAHDGCMYVGGTEGWQSYAQEDGCLHRVRLTGKPFPLPTAIESHNNGVIVRFSETLDPDSVNLKNTFCQQWNYLYSAGYGSPEFSIREPGRQGHDLVDVKSVRLLEDSKSIFLEIPQMHPAMQFHVHLRLKTAAGHEFKPDVLASIYELRSDFDQYPEYAAVPKRRAPDFPIAEKYEQDPRLVQQEKLGTDFGWVSSSLKISVSASAGLQFEPRQLRVAPGTRVSLAFKNGDPSMPHNVAVVKADHIDEFGEQSMQLASNPRAIATHYVPNDPAEICFSPILQPGDQYTMFFEAPKEPGEYCLVCTYPGHWRVMQGSLFVIPDGQPLPESANAPVRKFVKMWTMADLAADADTLAGRNYEQGRKVFEIAGCSKCHKLNEVGTVLGPDLSKIADRFKGQKLLQQMLEPSTEINKQYQTWVAALNDGRVISGMLLEQNDTSITLLPNPLKPETKISIARADIEELEASNVSTMPMSLLITFTQDEILDLLAFVQAGGQKQNPVFAKQ